VRLAIVGLGVMGGSLARALVRTHLAGGAGGRGPTEPSTSVWGWAANPADRAAAAEAGVEIGEHLEGTLLDAEVVVLATPLSTLPDLASTVLDVAPAGALVLDVASLQEASLAAAKAASLSARWVSAHPMVGSERSGFDASRADLYEGATVFLSADEGVPQERRDAAVRFWSRLGALPEWVVPEDHDDRMATVSHLPQLVATALADTIAKTGAPAEALGPGGRDTTRLAGSSVEMWRDLFEHARPALVSGLRDLAERLEEDASALEGGHLDVPVGRLIRAGAWRRGG